VSEQESQLSEVKIGRCHICAQLFGTEEDLLKHLKQVHGVKSLLQPSPE
jgi:peroxiredoxin family protein